MNRNYEIDLFLKKLSQIYIQNPNIEITSDTIYSELYKFNIVNNKYNPIPLINIEEERKRINLNYKENHKINKFFTHTGSFWAIENRGNLDEDNFYEAVKNSIKMYIAVDENNIEYVSQKIFDFMIENNIITQSKISRKLRTDSLVLRVEKVEDAKKITEYVNSLNYESKYKPNPFLFNQDKVSIAKDGELSFNTIISKIIKTYLNDRKVKNMLQHVSYYDFKNYVNMEFDYTSQYIVNNFNIRDDGEYNDYISIVDILKNNLNNTMSIDKFNKYDRNKKDGINEQYISSNVDINNIITTIIYNLSKTKSIEEIYTILSMFIINGNTRLFTRTDNIRELVINNINYNMFEKQLNNYVWNIFKNIYKLTLIKYSKEQATLATKKYIDEGVSNFFTNDNNAREILTKYTTPSYLKKVIKNKCYENGLNYDLNNIEIILTKTNEEKTRRIT